MLSESITLDVEYRRNDLGELTSNVPHVRVLHSPTGFEVGYGGSGPAEFALNILLAFGLSEDDAIRLHQEYKRQFIAGAPKDEGIIKGSETLAWLAAHRIDVEPTKVALANHQIASGVSKPDPLPSADKPKWVTPRVESLSWLPYSAADFKAWIDEPKREKSPECDYGYYWQHKSEIGQAVFLGWRISWGQIQASYMPCANMMGAASCLIDYSQPSAR